MSTDAPRNAVLLDRDGTLNVEVNYLSHPDQLELLPHTAAGLQRLQAAGWLLVVITNQSGVGRGYFDEAMLVATNERLRSILRAEGVELDGIYYCPHVPEAGCLCRKPSTGLVEQAAAELGFDPARAFVIGDKPSDIQLGTNVGAITILVRTGYGAGHEARGDTHPDYVVDDLATAAALILAEGGADRSTHRRPAASPRRPGKDA